MIYRTNVAVLLAIPEDWSELPEFEKSWHDAVAYTFGINAHDLSDAVTMALAAAKNAVGREGEFIGGVVIEVQCRCVVPKEFEGYEKHFHAAMDGRGIFYVSGVTSYGVSKAESAEAAAELEAMRESILHSGLPAPSFIHPKLPEEPPTRVRLLCSVCHHWIEVDNLDLIYSFMGGLDMFSLEQRDAWKSRKGVSAPFVHRHISECFLGNESSPRGIEAIHERDPRWSTLDDANRDDVNLL